MVGFTVRAATRSHRAWMKRCTLTVSEDRLELGQRSRPPVALRKDDVSVIEVVDLLQPWWMRIANPGPRLGTYLYVESTESKLMWQVQVFERSAVAVREALTSAGWPIKYTTTGVVDALRAPVRYFD